MNVTVSLEGTSYTMHLIVRRTEAGTPIGILLPHGFVTTADDYAQQAAVVDQLAHDVRGELARAWRAAGGEVPT